MAGLLDGKSALITGGGGGIGRATALAFAREGGRVAVADVAVEAARETVAQINAAGGQAIALAGEVTRDADVRAMVEDTVRHTAASTVPSTTPASPAIRSMPPARRRRTGPRKPSTA